MDKKVKKLQEKLKSRELDHYYADSWEQAAQITEDIEKIEAEMRAVEEKYIS